MGFIVDKKINMGNITDEPIIGDTMEDNDYDLETLFDAIKLKFNNSKYATALKLEEKSVSSIMIDHDYTYRFLSVFLDAAALFSFNKVVYICKNEDGDDGEEVTLFFMDIGIKEHNFTISLSEDAIDICLE